MGTVENNKQIKAILQREFPGVRVKRGNGTASGWSKVYMTISRPPDCRCEPAEYLCPACKEAWRTTMDRAQNMIKDVPSYHYYDDMGDCHAQVNIFIDFAPSKSDTLGDNK